MEQLKLFDDEEEDTSQFFVFEPPVISTVVVTENLPKQSHKPKIVVEKYSAQWVMDLLHRKVIKKFNPTENPHKASIKAGNFIDALKLVSNIQGHTAAKKPTEFDGEQYLEFKEV